MRDVPYLLIGGGLAAASAVDGIREVDPDGEIIVVAEEDIPPYHRPPLSKEFLQNPEVPEEMLQVKPTGWFEQQSGTTLLTGERATSLDQRTRRVRLASGPTVRGERVLIATGGRPRTLPLEGGSLDNVRTFRTVEDARAVRAAVGTTERVVLVGAGFIGMELAASLRTLGVEAMVVDIADRVWPRVLPLEVSAFVQGYFEERGVEFRLAGQVDRLEGEEQVERVILESGELVPCDLVIVGVGLVPNDEIAATAGLAVHDGVVVDIYGETSAGHVYAAGDVARFPHGRDGALRRVEHWDHARTQGAHVGRNMAGRREPYEHLSYFFSHAFELSLSAVGETAGSEDLRIHGELGSGRSVVYCVAGGRVAGAILINASDALERARGYVQERVPVDELDGMDERHTEEGGRDG